LTHFWRRRNPLEAGSGIPAGGARMTGMVESRS